MRHPLSTLALLGALVAPLTLGTAPARSADAASAPTARVIVKFKADSALVQQRRQALAVGERHTQRAEALGRRVGLGLRSGASVAQRAQVVLASGIDSAALAARLAKEPDVEYAVADERRRRLAAPNDPLYPNGQLGAAGPAVGQWYLRAPAGEVKSSIDIEPAWAVTIGDPNIVVAVLDTGVRFDHVDLQPVAAGGKLLPGYDMITDLSIANDGDARDADASDPGDWEAAGECSSGDPATDSSWHGTQTAGVVGALTNNGIGMASVGRNVRVLPVRVLGKCGGDDSDIVAGMLWAAGIHVDGVPDNPNPARVLNLSLGSAGACTALYADAMAQLTARNVVVVASAGNRAGHSVATPANCSGIIAVSGLRHVGTKVGFSDIGPEVALSAPGGNCINILPGQPCLYPILTTSNSGLTAPNAGGSIYTDSFNYSLGTSFSAPQVAATAALMLSVQPAMAPGSVRAMLRSTARPFPTTGGTAGTLQCVAPNGTDQLECYCTTSTCGAGMLDAGAAVLAAGGLQAVIGVTPTLPVANANITLSAAGSLAATGRSIVAWQWTLADGGGIVSAFNGATNAVTASVTPSAAGVFTVTLTVTDDQGQSTHASRSIAVSAVPPPPTPAPPPATGGGGGGALGIEWLAGLALGVAALRRRRPG